MNKKNTLIGLRVLNTRPAAQAHAFSQALREAGAIPIEFPTLAIEATSLDWCALMPPLSAIKHAIFISPNAVSCFFNAIKPTSWPPSINTIAMGKGTALALTVQGIIAHHIPTRADSECLLALDTLHHIKNETILLVKGEGGLPVVKQTLVKRGAQVLAPEVYRRMIPSLNKKRIHALWHDDAVDMILITSQQAMQHLFTLFGPAARGWLCSKPFLVLSSRLANIAAAYGVKTMIQSDYNALVKTLEEYMNEG